MPPTIAYVTAKAPYGKGEVWALREFLSFRETGIGMLLIPRSYSRIKAASIAANLDDCTIHIQLLNPGIILHFLATAIRHPKLIVELVFWIIRWSNNIKDFLKGLVILPKSLYLGEILSTEGIVHIHAHSTTNVAVIAYVISRLFGIPWSLTLHSSSIVNETHRRSFAAFLDTASFIRCVNNESCEKLTYMFGQEYQHKLKVIHLGVKPVELIKDNRKSDGFVIVTPASLNEQKGHKYAIEACQILLSRDISDFKWIFYGTGSLKSELKRLIFEKGLNQNIIVGGFIENDALLELYKKGCIQTVILPSIIGSKGTYEGIPYSLMEAMAYGIPVVVTDTGGAIELIEDETGILLPPNSSIAIADAIVKLKDDPGFRYSIGKAGQQKVMKEFNIYDTVHQLKKIMNLGDNV